MLDVADASEEICKDDREIAEAVWMPIDDYLSLPYYAAAKGVYGRLMHLAAAVARGEAPGMAGDDVDLGFMYGSLGWDNCSPYFLCA